MSRTLGRRVTAGIAMTVLAAGAGTAVVPTASAARGDQGYVVAGAPVRPCPSLGCNPSWNSVGSWVYMDCWHDTYEGGAWRRWFKYLNNNLWVQADHVAWPQPQLPQC